jgi:hypothetical protein
VTLQFRNKAAGFRIPDAGDLALVHVLQRKSHGEKKRTIGTEVDLGNLLWRSLHFSQQLAGSHLPQARFSVPTSSCD